MMAQYGFIPSQGNGGDQIDFGFDLESLPAEARICGVRMQRLLGDAAFISMMLGEAPR